MDVVPARLRPSRAASIRNSRYPRYRRPTTTMPATMTAAATSIRR